jgi:VWFA-related protein
MRLNPIFPLALFATFAHGQTPAAQPPSQVSAPSEVSTQEESVIFKSRVNLVLVPVVVRDKGGKIIDNLRQQDFQLLDKGKPQVITKFSIEKSGGKVISGAPELERIPGEAAPETSSIVAADHFVAFLFDDVHIDFASLVQTRQAAEKHISANLKPADRVAIYTTSGQTTLDFTDDRDLLRQTLLKLAPHPIARTSMQECPDISFYMADLIVNKHDDQALNASVLEVMTCAQITDRSSAISMAQSAASRVLNSGEHESRVALLSIKNIVRRMALMPGQRMIVLVSPGFLRLTDEFQDETAIIDQAIRSSVTINTLDARGLYTNTPDISKRTISIQAEQVKQQIDRQAASADADILAELAAGTGGTFVENTNDLVRGLRELSAAPDAYYILGFSPQNLKLDGAYHSLRITVRIPAGLNVKARRGYYAPKHLSNADEDAKEEISQALFSREEMHDIPIDMHTQFFKASGTEARLVVISRLDVRKLRFRKADGRNSDDVVIVSGLFDRNGNYLQSISKTLKMRLLDGTLENKLNAGISIRSDFKVAPGTYVIRLVVRDAEGQMMAAQNGAVEIP